jgi:4-hydroxybenzoate polyprenyltransferase
MTADIKTPDAAESWVDRAPTRSRPYLRLMRADRPIGVWLLFLPCIWGSLVARPAGFPADTMYWFWTLFLIGAFVMRSAGCVYNDLVDRDIDRKVARTADRPLASGSVTPKAAWVLIVALCLIGFLVLVQFNLTAILVGVLSLGLVAAYPFMKRITWWPQAWLGLTFNWGVLVGGAAVSGTVGAPVLLYYVAGIFWTLGYDTIYAQQDVEDDALVGVRSSARRLGPASRTGIAIFYALSVAFAAAAALTAGAGVWTLLLVPAALHLGWQVWRFDPASPATSLALFKSNVWAGLLLALPALAA